MMILLYQFFHSVDVFWNNNQFWTICIKLVLDRTPTMVKFVILAFYSGVEWCFSHYTELSSSKLFSLDNPYQLRTGGLGSKLTWRKPPCTLMAPGACKIHHGCNVLQVPIQIITLGMPKRGSIPPWQIKIVMACLRIILQDESKTGGDSPLALF